MKMQGRRRDNVEPHLFEPGDYGLWSGTWYCRTPPNVNGESFLGNLAGHAVTVNSDETITVSPSILVSSGVRAPREEWHGFLEAGVWRSC